MNSDVKLDKLIYLDTEFISRKYEEDTGKNPTELVTKQEGGKAGINTVLLRAGVHTHESRSFSLTSRQMLQEVWQKLQDVYPKFDPTKFKNYTGTDIFWIEGTLTLAEWSQSGSEEKGFEFLQLNHDGLRTAFLVEVDYLAAGFKRLFDASVALKGNIDIPVQCLVRVMWHVDKARNYVACPYIIIET